MNRQLSLPTPHGPLRGALDRPERPRALLLIPRVHHSMQHNLIAASLAAAGYAILSMELLTAQEIHFADAAQNVAKLAQRLLDTLDLIQLDGDTQDLPLAIFAVGDLAPAAVRVAARRDLQVHTLICHGGLIDRAGREALKLLKAPLLMLFDAGGGSERSAFQRARPLLGAPCAERILTPGEDAAPHIGAWLHLNLPAFP